MEPKEAINSDRLVPTRPQGYFKGGMLFIAGLSFAVVAATIFPDPGRFVTAIWLIAGGVFLAVGGYYLKKYDHPVE